MLLTFPDRRSVLRLLGCAALAASAQAVAGAARAAHLPAPVGPIVLRISGAISHGNGPTGVEFDWEMLQTLPGASLKTTTPWTEGRPTFSGVLMRDVLDLVGVDDGSVLAIALNDYSYEIPIADFHRYPVVLAWEVDGHTLTPRDKGPLWIMYPLDEFSGREKQDVELKLVWQLTELKVL